MLAIQERGQTIKHYLTPGTLDEAITLLNEHAPQARLVAGATDLWIECERNQRPGLDTLIDITRIPELNRIRIFEEEQRIEIGCLVTHNQIVGDERLHQDALPLVQACWEVGSPQLRNRATVVGNVVTASPANDTITPLFVQNAMIHTVGLDGGRDIPIAEFYTGVRQTVLKPNEMVTHLSMDRMLPEEKGVYVKLGLRRAQAISVVHLAIFLRFDQDDRVDEARLALGSVAPTIIRVDSAEQALIGRALTDDMIEVAAALTANTPQPIDDLRSTADYRTHMLRVIVTRALNALRDNQQIAPQDPVMLWGLSNGIFPVGADYASELGEETEIAAIVNGQPIAAPNAAGKSLLHWLREDVRLESGNLAIGTKEGCSEGECGACTVYLDGMAVMSCITPAGRANQAEITTIEGIGYADQLHPIQEAFVDAGAVQCGYCIPGFIMSGAKLLEERLTPDESDIEQAFSGNLCRCTGYYKIVEAMKRTAQAGAEEVAE